MKNDHHLRLTYLTLAAVSIFVAWSLFSIFQPGFSLPASWGLGIGFLIANAFVYVIAARQYGFARAAIMHLVIFLIIVAAYVLNMWRAWPFGPLVFHEALGWKFYGIAWPAPVFWTYVVVSFLLLMQPRRMTRDPKDLFSWSFDAALAVMVFSVIVEPVVFHGNVLTWLITGPVLGIPFSSFLGWFLTPFVATVAAIFMAKLWVPKPKLLPMQLPFVLALFQFAFFALALELELGVIAIIAAVAAIILFIWSMRLYAKQDPLIVKSDCGCPNE